MKESLKGFMEFVRAHGVVGLAVGLVMGGAVSKVVSSLVADIINPLLGPLLGSAGDLKSLSIPFFSSQIMIGNFIATILDFVVIAFVVYYVVNKMGLDKLDKKA